jgi:large repetitive protein
MATARLIRAALVFVTVLALPVTLASQALAAKPTTASVTVTVPADGTSTLVGGVAMSGKASVPSGGTLVLSVDGTVTGASVPVARNGTWSSYLYVGRVGVHELCAEVRSSSSVLASDCVTWTMLPDPSQFSLDQPYEGYQSYDTVRATGRCQPGASVSLVLDGGEPLVVACDPEGYGWDHVYSSLTVGQHTLEASLLALDGSAIATRSVTWQVSAIPQPAVEITSPEDGGAAVGAQVLFTGTVTNSGEYLQFTVDGNDYTSTYIGRTLGTVSFEKVLGLPYGTHEVCAVVTGYYEGTASDCITYSVLVAPESFSLRTPEEGGLANGPVVAFAGNCTAGSDISAVLDDGSSGTVRCDDFGSFYLEVAGVADGAHTATLTNTFAGTPITSVTVSFTVDSTPPAPPVVASPAPGSTISTMPVYVTGTAEPLGTVTLLLPDGRGYTSAYVNEDGTWALDVFRDWFEAAGVLTGKRTSVTLTFTTTDRLGRVSEPVSVTYTTRLR